MIKRIHSGGVFEGKIGYCRVVVAGGFAHVAGIVFALMALWTFRRYAVPIICFVYIAFPLLRYAGVPFRQAEKTPPASSGKVA